MSTGSGSGGSTTGRTLVRRCEEGPAGGGFRVCRLCRTTHEPAPHPSKGGGENSAANRTPLCQCRANFAQEQGPGRQNVTFVTAPARDPALEGFLALLATRRAPRTVDAYRRDLAHVSAFLGRSPAEATTEDLERYLAELRAAGLAPATLARRVAAIRAFFGHQQLLSDRTDNPAA
jgi:hypothetical protein